MQKSREVQEQKWIRRIKLFGSKKDADQLVRSYYMVECGLRNQTAFFFNQPY